MKKVFIIGLLFILVYGCAGSSQFTKTERNVGNVLKFFLDIMSLGLIFTGHGSPAHIPSASVDAVFDFGKAVDSLTSEKVNEGKAGKEGGGE